MLRLFDPWSSKLCMCPVKYSLSPYTGCPHRCLYCYITSYVPDAFHCRPKRGFTAWLEKSLKTADGRIPVSIANSSDPYPPLEEWLNLTRKTLQLLAAHGFKVNVMTKSNLVVRDLDILCRGGFSVSLTITTLNPDVSRRMEPGAPPPARRLKALEELSRGGVPCSVRIDPVIPCLNDDPDTLGSLVEEVAVRGARHVVSSTFKARGDSFKRVVKAFPEIRGTLHRLYFERGEVHGRSRYLPRSLRLEIMGFLRSLVSEKEMSFATCRENLPPLGTGASCDGTHLIPGRGPVFSVRVGWKKHF